MKSKWMTLAGAALFILGLEAGASAATYNVSGGWLVDSFGGTIDVSGTTVSSPNITLSGPGLSGDLDLTTLLGSSYHTFPVDYFTAVVDNGITGVGNYTLAFDFTLPSTKGNGILDFATLVETVDHQVCRRGNCTEVPETLILRAFGLGDVTLDVIGTTSATPLPLSLPLFATGLVILGLFGWRRNRSNTTFGAAA